MKGKFIFESRKPETIQVSQEYKISVVNNLKDFHTFYRVPWQVYKNDDYWVPTFWKELKDFFKKSNPFWDHAEARLFIAYKDNIVVGRIVSIVDYLFIEKEKKKIGYFGFFDCIDDYNVASALFNVAQKYLESKDMKTMRGPINGRVDVGCGFLYKGFSSSPYVLGSYSPKYYINFVEKFGMKKCRDLLSYYLDLEKPIPTVVKEVAKHVETKGISIRGFNRFRVKKEIDWWIPLMMNEFSFHWGYVPISEKEVKTRFGVKQARWFVDPGLFLIAEADGKPISFKWSTPDYNQVFKHLNGRLGPIEILKFLINKRKINQGKFNFVGIKKEYRKHGIGTFMNYYTMLEMKRRGYTNAECGWIDEENIASRKAIEKIGAKLYKIFRVYEKNI